MKVLGIEVAPVLVERWVEWLAPRRQPFYLTPSEVSDLGVAGAGVESELTPELRDTFAVWNIDRGLSPIWLDEPGFAALPRVTRARLVRAQVVHGRGAVSTVRGWADIVDVAGARSQGDGHRFVWWPSMVKRNAEAILGRVVGDRESPSRHASVPSRVWRSAAGAVPRARALAGTFPSGSGANCLGTVMAACGQADADEVWMAQPPFENWLQARAHRGGHDDAPGTVLVWRDRTGLSQHAAVTLGGRWAIHKPSQTWMTPRAVLPVADIIRIFRAPRQRLYRYTPTVGRFDG